MALWGEPNELSIQHCVYIFMQYCIAKKFGKGTVWQIDFYRAFGERRFGELIDQRNRLLIVSTGFSLVNHGQLHEVAN